MKIIGVILFSITWGLAQNIDITGRMALKSEFVDYNEISHLAIDTNGYSRSDIIPGLAETLNLSLFARTTTLEMSLISDVSYYKEWQNISIDDIQRLTGTISSDVFNVILGDFFEYRNTNFLSNRDVRGAKLGFSFSESATISAFYGRLTKELSTTDLLYGQYETFNASGVYERKAFGVYADFDITPDFTFSVNGLLGNDKENYNLGTTSAPLNNRVGGVNLKYKLLNNQFKISSEFFISQLDSLYENEPESETYSDKIFKTNIEYKYNNWFAEIGQFHYGPDYFTMGNPYLEVDKEGYLGKLSFQSPEQFYVSLSLNTYENNLNNDSTYTTKTNYRHIEVGTQFSDYNIIVSNGYQVDESNTLIIDDQPTFLDKTSSTTQVELTLDLGTSRFSSALTYIDYDDQSVFEANGVGLSSQQTVFSINYYFGNAEVFDSSGGFIYSSTSSEGAPNTETTFFYSSSRYTLIPHELRLEAELNINLNAADRDFDVEEEDEASSKLTAMLSNYKELSGKISVEYFLNFNTSFKLFYGAENKEFDYLKDNTVGDLQKLTAEVGDELYFNKNETYHVQIFGLELNVLF